MRFQFGHWSITRCDMLTVEINMHVYSYKETECVIWYDIYGMIDIE